MMKYKIIMMSMLLLIGVSSCEKYVDETQNWGAISEEGVWEDATKIELLVNAWYQRLRGTNPNRPDGNYGAENSSSVTCYHVGCAEAPLSRWGWVHEFNYDPHWKDLRVINQFLGNIDDASAPNLTAVQKAQFKGQAHFFRAYIYFELVKVFGGVPLITEVLDITGDPALLDLPRNTSLEVFEFIEQELNLAIDILPIRGNDGYADARVDKIAALAMKAKILRTKAMPRFCKTKVDAYWQDAMNAVNATKAAADAQGMGLAPDAVAMWFDQPMMRDKELLLYEQVLRPSRSNTMQRPSSTGGNSGVNKMAWQMVKDYPMANGLSIDDPASGYDEDMWWANRDPRLSQNLGFNGQLNEFPDFPGNRTWMFKGSGGGGRDANNHGWFRRKYTNSNWDLATAQQSSAFDFAYIRYTEVILWEAECANELGNSSVAFDNIKLIRERAGIPAGTDGRYGLAADVGSDYQKTLDAIYTERDMELFLENSNHQNLIERDNLGLWNSWVQYEKNEPLLNIPVFNALNLVDDDGAVTASDPTTSAEWTRIINALTAEMNSLATEAERDLLVASISINDIRVTNDTYIIEIPDYYIFPAYWQAWLDKSPALEQTIGWDNGTFDPRITN